MSQRKKRNRDRPEGISERDEVIRFRFASRVGVTSPEIFSDVADRCSEFSVERASMATYESDDGIQWKRRNVLVFNIYSLVD